MSWSFQRDVVVGSGANRSLHERAIVAGEVLQHTPHTAVSLREAGISR